jgi:hypothetical protein
MQTQPDLDTALSENEAAQFLGVSVRTLQAYRAGRGKGPDYVKIGSRVTYTRRDLVAFQQSHRVAAGGAPDPKGAE